MIPFATGLRAALVAGALTLFLAAAVYVLHLHRRAERAEADLAAARAEVATETAQAGVERGAAAVADRVQTRALAITVRAQEAEHDIRRLPEADTPLPDALRDRLRAGLLGLRERGAAPGAVDGASGGEPARALSEALR